MTPTVAFETRALKPGRYQLETEIRAGEQVVARDSQDFEKRPLPEWHGNRIGLSDGVPPPFTPIQVKGTALECWGRRYALDGRLLPSSIRTGGRELLTADANGCFIGVQLNEFGFTALTSERREVVRRFGDRLVVERPTVEDLMVHTLREDVK